MMEMGMEYLIHLGELITNGENSYRHGKGKMTWLGGYEYEGKWDYDCPEDEKHIIHPMVLECLGRGSCTREVSNDDHSLPQMIWWCKTCSGTFCELCNQNWCCHGCDSSMKQLWTDKTNCHCEREDCVKEQNKRRKLE
eukprot:TRINITY_DN348_c0_g3_i1.p1 TRINITY_DN348_c0_g3~~TRINITY_DN348_c0_g3_i1.p1  ORF type:complete len:138 (+),score=15.58 TRINITY_DN348_c0_g3_i1:447-860(+)